MSFSTQETKSRVPPGQVVTKGWPVLHAGSVPILTKECWSLRIHGKVENPLTLTYSDLLKLKYAVLTCDIHCVTTWSRMQMMWEGVKFKDLMDVAKPTRRANFPIFECEQG